MLEFRQRNGNRLAVPYGWIERIEFDPSEGITLHASSMQIRIRGQNLNAEVRAQIRLFDGLTRQRVPWIAERATEISAASQEITCVIDYIEW